ncbi:xanthine dehydrogenase small subunit [Chitinophaga sp. YR627]|uniref:FAD binding domain-containing protein n=1 Tax=Chitinophaga sp. YR627 TaxID=1881041 RepID=UPI0008E07F91|nr:FAD binding domain-containing protein [Chitinophaga sp. YR627]SFO98460.1 xanthine dehydrogenase small subunit [Chitinophaga sp. YR627]
MLKFILNNEDVGTTLPPGMPLLDFIRYHQHLTGTKTGCNEGDCGACTILAGELKQGVLVYRAWTSCLTPLGNAHGKHIVTIEGVNMLPALNPIQQAMADNCATQCGFCTPGFVMSLAGFCLDRKTPDTENAIAAIDGNICRCTGYKSIERAAGTVAGLLTGRNGEEPALFATGQQILPEYFAGIKERLKSLIMSLNGELNPPPDSHPRFVGGGTDLYVQQPETIQEQPIRFLLAQELLKGITREDNHCVLGASVTVSDILESAVMRTWFPALGNYLKLVSSTPIRNMATIAGNFVNASPIGDMTIFFLALDTTLELSDGQHVRTLPLRDFYKGYKQLNKTPEEYITRCWFELPGDSTGFHFEKVSKRTHLDIASVNSAISITMNANLISDIRISAGGVGPVPLLLTDTAAFLKGKAPGTAMIRQACAIAQLEITPISDTRGTAAYKRLLLEQLIKAHFITLFPTLQVELLL